MLTLKMTPNPSKHRTMSSCAAECRAKFMSGTIEDEAGEAIATVNTRGVVRDLDGKVVVLHV